MSDNRIKLLKKLRSYRSAKLGSIFLAATSLFGMLMILASDEIYHEAFGPIYAATFFWPAVAYICHLKIKIFSYELRDMEDQDTA